MPGADTKELTCPICGKVYVLKLWQIAQRRRPGCSRQCSIKIRTARMRKIVVLACAQCGGRVERRPWELRHKGASKRGLVFCGPKCQQVFRPQRRNGEKNRITPETRAAWKERNRVGRETRRRRGTYAMGEEQKRKLSRITAAALASGKYASPSKLEKKVESILLDSKAPFVPQQKFDYPGGGSFVVDFWLPSLNLVLEINGTYWHADPRAFPAPRYPIQVRRRARDAAVADALFKKGIRLAVLWELDLDADAKGCVLSALRAAREGELHAVA